MAALQAPAALGQLDVTEVALAAGRLYGTALPVIAAGIAGPVYGQHRAGVAVVRMGTTGLSQLLATAAYGYKLDKTTLALQAGYYQLALGDGPTVARPTFTLAGQTELFPRVILAGQVSNLSQPRLSPTTTERLPAGLRASIAFKASDDLWLLAQTDKTLNRAAGLAFAAEYRVHRYCRLRAGAAPWPGLVGMGVRLDVWGSVVEYGLAYHGLLGQVHSLGVGWSLAPGPQARIQSETVAP